MNVVNSTSFFFRNNNIYLRRYFWNMIYSWPEGKRTKIKSCWPGHLHSSLDNYNHPSWNFFVDKIILTPSKNVVSSNLRVYLLICNFLFCHMKLLQHWGWNKYLEMSEYISLQEAAVGFLKKCSGSNLIVGISKTIPFALFFTTVIIEILKIPHFANK